MISKLRSFDIAHALYEAYKLAEDENCTGLVVTAAYDIAAILKDDNPKFSQADFIKVVLGR